MIVCCPVAAQDAGWDGARRALGPIFPVSPSRGKFGAPPPPPAVSLPAQRSLAPAPVANACTVNPLARSAAASPAVRVVHPAPGVAPATTSTAGPPPTPPPGGGEDAARGWATMCVFGRVSARPHGVAGGGGW